LVDWVTYDGQPPWPSAANGRGGSLQRAAAAAPGLDAASWSALAPTPGTVRFAEIGDLDFSGVVDDADIHRFARLVADPTAYQATHGVPATMVADVDGDGNVDFDDIDDFVDLVHRAAADAAARSASQPSGVDYRLSDRHSARLASDSVSARGTAARHGIRRGR
jgi:hypothetical protein